MNKIKLILNHTDYKRFCKKNEKFEKERKFCRHDLNHFADVARIAYIYNLEKNLGFQKEVIYAAALLHDIGKWKQYEKGIPHNESSAKLSCAILSDCQFAAEDTKMIIDAIFTHRRYEKEDDTLNHILYLADKKSRKCFQCKKEKDCNWENDIKNFTLEY